MELVTGRKGEAHVTSQQDRMLHQGIFGVEAYILNTGKKLRPEVQSSNEIRIRDGALMVQGALSCVKINTYDSITIQNGTQGMKRIDLVVWQYAYNAENDTEYSEWNVIQGTPDEIEPHMPEYIQGDIQSGDNFVQVPYLAVHLDGINITEVRTLLEVIPDIYTTNKNLTNSVDELNRKLLPWDAWRQSFLGTHIYRLQFGDINGNIIQTNQLSIPWLPSEVTVALSKINIPGAGTIAIDYKSAYLTTEGGLYIYCSTAGAAGVASLKWQVVDATIVIQRK